MVNVRFDPIETEEEFNQLIENRQMPWDLKEIKFFRGGCRDDNQQPETMTLTDLAFRKLKFEDGDFFKAVWLIQVIKNND